MNRAARLLRALVAPELESYAEMVVVGNSAASCVAGGAAWLVWGASFRVVCAVIVGVFVGLTACLLSRYTFWLSAVCGGIAMSIVPAAVLAGVGLRYDWDGAPWIGAGIGFAFGVGFTSFSVVRVVRASRGNE